MIKIEHNVETNTITEVDFTKEEIAVCKKDRELAQKEKLDTELEANKKLEKIQPILDRLGLTADELKLILG